MADNIKYIRWAAKALRVIMVLNILTGFGGMFITVGVTAASGLSMGRAAIPVGSITIVFQFITVLINAFLIYTAARGLELLADIAYHLLITWHQQVSNSS